MASRCKATGLTKLELAFVAAYLDHYEPTRAYLEAGYRPQKTATATARQANKVLKRAAVLAAIAEGRKSIDRRVVATPERVFVEAAACAFSDMSRYVDLEALLGRTLTPMEKAAVKKVKVKRVTRGQGVGAVTTTDTELELYDKLAAMRLLAALHGDLERDPEGRVARGHVQVRINLPGREPVLIEAQVDAAA